MSELARQQLIDLAERSCGAIELGESVIDGRWTVFEVALNTRGIVTVPGKGIPVRAHHRFEIVVDDRFPFHPPAVRANHLRWAGTPHVQWGRLICLYAAPSVEWNPADGMRGLIDRLITWLQRAAEGSLDPEGHPLHPPVTYGTFGAGWIVVNPNLGHRMPWEEPPEDRSHSIRLYAWCERTGNRIDIREWLTLDQTYARVLDPAFGAVDANGRPYYVASALIIDGELGMEYPDQARRLVSSLESLGVDKDEVLRALTSADRINRAITARAGSGDSAPTVMLLGTPSRRVAGARRLCHLTAWRLGDLGDDITRLLARLEHRGDDLSNEVRRLSEDWLDVAEINWMTIYENRPEVTQRRDHDSAASWLKKKKILILGCGALGAPIAEHCVRAGANSLTLVDSGLVDPGILVRQPYSDADIGFNKARMLAKRLRGISRDVSVDADRGDAVSSLIAKDLRPEEFDLVIDATADVSVRTALEAIGASNRAKWPPLISPIIGHDAQRGVVSIAHRGSTGRGRDILRRLGIHAHSQGGEWCDIADDLFPYPPRAEMFFPEPGCSAPTFTGSAMQTEGLAATLLWAAIAQLRDDATGDPMIAVAVRLPGADTAAPTVSRASWSNDVTIQEMSSRFEVRLSQRAMAQMRTETRNGLRIRGAQVETGGMLLGSVDEAAQCIYVDIATGPSPDSVSTTESFDFGTHGSDETIQHYRQRTHDRCHFVGMWHTHPFGPTQPSRRDEEGMAGLVADGTTKWSLMLILGGPADKWQRWCDDGDLPDIYARLVDDGEAAEALHSPRPQTAGQMPADNFSYLTPPAISAKPTWWQRLRRTRRGSEG